MFYNLAQTTPEIRRYWLRNKINDQSVLVTDYDLETTFDAEEVMKIRSNRHHFFYIEECFEESLI